MFYVLIAWFEKLKQTSKGYMEIINYADDMVICFEHKSEAEEVYELMKERMKQCGLEMAEDKTRLIKFGKYAAMHCKRNGEMKPETFDFLGFTHYCGVSKKGNFRVKRKTSKKKLKQKVKEFKFWIKQNRETPIKELIPTIKKKLIGHYNYYGITDNTKSINKYRYCIIMLLYKWLNRRSQRNSYTLERFWLMIKFYDLPKAKVMVNIW